MITRNPEELRARNLAYARMIAESKLSTPSSRQSIIEELQLAPTPKEVIYSENTLKLYRFTPVKEELHPVPLVIVPSLILKYYIMDLMKGHSLIEHLVGSGIDTYLIDWGTPGEEHGRLTLDDYIGTFMRRCVRQVRSRTGAGKVDLLGQCIGGILTTLYSALFCEQVGRMISLTAPVDFEDAGILALWTDGERFDVDRIVESFGSVVAPDFIHMCFQFLDVEATVERYKKLYNNVLDETFLFYYRALDTWLNDTIPFPGQVFRKFIHDFYQRNLLIKGEMSLCGRKVDLGKITCPVLAITAEQDHVFPEKAAKALVPKVGGPTAYHTIAAGHVTLIAVFPQRAECYRIITDFLKGPQS